LGLPIHEPAGSIHVLEKSATARSEYAISAIQTNGAREAI
jgi:hypothetical protein